MANITFKWDVRPIMAGRFLVKSSSSRLHQFFGVKMKIKHIVSATLSLVLFCSQAANAAIIEIVESGLISNLNPGQEFFNGVNVAGLPYTRTFFINTLASGSTYEDRGDTRALSGGNAPLSILGSSHQPSVAFVTYTMAIAGSQFMQFSSEGKYSSAIQLKYSSTEAQALIINSRTLGDPNTTGSEFDLAQLVFPVSYPLPTEPNFIYSGTYLSAGIDNGGSAGFVGFYVTPGVPQTTGRFDLIPTKLVVTVSEVPVPAAVWLFGSVLVGFVGFGRRESI